MEDCCRVKDCCRQRPVVHVQRQESKVRARESCEQWTYELKREEELTSHSQCGIVIPAVDQIQTIAVGCPALTPERRRALCLPTTAGLSPWWASWMDW